MKMKRRLCGGCLFDGKLSSELRLVVAITRPGLVVYVEALVGHESGDASFGDKD